MTTYTVPTPLWTPSPNYSSRGGAKVRLVVVHDCEGSEAGAVATFANPKSQVSAHSVLSADGTHRTDMVDWENKAWACVDYNAISDNIEMPGFAAKGYGSSEWDAMAAMVAWRCKVRGLPPVWARDVDTDDYRGFTSHFYLGKKGGGHTDPTTDTGDWALFCAKVAEAYEQVGGDEQPQGVPAMPQKAPAGFVPHGDVRHGFAVGSLEWAQAALNAIAGGWYAPLVVDGILGSATRRALGMFQAEEGLVADGILGPLTTAALQKALAA